MPIEVGAALPEWTRVDSSGLEHAPSWTNSEFNGIGVSSQFFVLLIALLDP